MKKGLHLKQVFILAAMAAALFMLPAAVQAATVTGGATLKQGSMYYLRDKDISGNSITSNSFVVQPQTAGTSYDIVYAQGTRSQPQEYLAVNVTKTLRGAATSAYIKKTASNNVGMLVGIYVRKGSVKLSVTSNGTSSKFVLKLVKLSKTPVAFRTVAKNRKIRFDMATGNLTAIPLIFGGINKTRIRRNLDTNRYELYVFGATKMKRTTYYNGKAVASKTFTYETSYTYSGRLYHCKLMPISAVNVKTSGWMQTTKGRSCFFYPRDYLGLKFTLA